MQSQANALAQARTQRSAAASDGQCAHAAALAEQVRQARLSECRCFAGGADGHAPGCVGTAKMVLTIPGANLGLDGGVEASAGAGESGVAAALTALA